MKCECEFITMRCVCGNSSTLVVMVMNHFSQNYLPWKLVLRVVSVLPVVRGKIGAFFLEDPAGPPLSPHTWLMVVWR